MRLTLSLSASNHCQVALKRVQHDNRVRVSFFCHPELVSGSRFLVLRIWVLKPRPYMLNYPKILLVEERHFSPVNHSP